MLTSKICTNKLNKGEVTGSSNIHSTENASRMIFCRTIFEQTFSVVESF